MQGAIAAREPSAQGAAPRLLLHGRRNERRRLEEDPVPGRPLRLQQASADAAAARRQRVVEMVAPRFGEPRPDDQAAAAEARQAARTAT